MPRLLLVCPHFPPSSASGSFRMLGFARHLPAAGWNASVVCGDRMHWEPSDTELLSQVPEDTSVYRVAYPTGAALAWNRHLSKTLQLMDFHQAWVRRAWKICLRAARMEQIDAVLTSGPPHAVHSLGYRLKTHLCLPWAVDLRDPWNDIETDSSWLGFRSRRWEKKAMAASDLVLANAPRAAIRLKQRFDGAKHKIALLPNGFDPPASIDAHHMEDRNVIRICHAGEIYLGRNPRIFLDALQDVQSLGNNQFHTTFLGRCQWSDCDLQHEANRRSLEKSVEIKGQVTHSQVQRELDRADILLLLDESGRTCGVPAKVYEYIGFGCPILALAERDSDTEWALRESGAVFRIVHPRDRTGIRAALKCLADDIQSGLIPKTNELAIQKFSRSALAKEFVRQLNNICDSSARYKRTGIANSGGRILGLGQKSSRMGSWPRPRIHVCHLIGGLDVGGAEKLVAGLAQHADRKRFESSIICLGSRGPVAEEIESSGSQVICLNKPLGWRPGVVVRLARTLRAERIQILHCHNTAALVYGVPAARLAGIKRVIHTRHGPSHGASRRGKELFRWCVRAVDTVACVSEHTCRLAIAEGASPFAVVPILNGIDASRFGFHGPASDGPIVTVARLSHEKGIDLLIHAMKLLSNDWPAVQLEIAGDGPERSALQALVRSLGLGETVQFLGNESDVAAVLNRSRLFVLPSRVEGMPLTILEAMASGLPVVATSVGGNAEIVQHQQTGVLVQENSPAAIAHAIRYLLADPRTAKEMGKRGRQRVVNFFDIRRTAKLYEQHYVKPLPRASKSETQMPQGSLTVNLTHGRPTKR